MTTSRFVRRPERLQQMRDGPLGIYIDQVATQYVEEGYARLYATTCLTTIGAFGDWLKRSGLTARDIDERLIERFLCDGSMPVRYYRRRALRKLLAIVRERGDAPAAAAAQGPNADLERDFAHHLAAERGLAARTVENYSEAAQTFLAAMPNKVALDWHSLSAADVLRFVQRTAAARSPVFMQQLCTGLRAFFRFLLLRGAMTTDLARVVPRIARWRLATIPVYLSREQVQRVLAHCDRSTAIGRRKYAILLLLARLGLRAKEITSLTLDDIDWRQGQLIIRGKGRGPEPMPLPSDVGEALAAYLHSGRPATRSRVIFVRHQTPHTPLADARGLTSIVIKAMRAAKIDAPRKGTHVFRHTLATQMLREGASLTEIGQVLRHRDEDTTRIYAKVDLTRLRTLALPWLGGAL